METTIKILSTLEDSKFKAGDDIQVLKIAVDLIFAENKSIWQRGSSKDREALSQLLAGELELSPEALTKRKDLQGLVIVVQALLLLALSLVNGLGRSPVAVARKDNQLKVKFVDKLESWNLTLGKFDAEMGKLIREFKRVFYGKVTNEKIGRTELYLIKETLDETRRRLKTEKSVMSSLAKDPGLIFSNKNSGSYSTYLFLVLSALPVETLNNLLINVGSYLPDDLEELNEDKFRVKVRNYFSSSTQELHELFKKIRLLVKLYFGRHREIITIIVKDKTKKLFQELLENKENKKLIQDNLRETIQDQFELRIKTFEALQKIF